jgi:hypothetical protein
MAYAGETERGASLVRELIAGALPRTQRRLVEAWAELHQDELKADWERLQAGRPALPIAPLQ